jgi:cell division protein FtsI/penicillin-binding protein 2
MRGQTLSHLLFRLGSEMLGALGRTATIVLGLIAGGSALAASLWVGSSVLAGFGEEVATIPQLRAEHPVQRTGAVAGELFKKLVAERWVVFNAATSTLDVLVDCDALAQGLPYYDRRSGTVASKDGPASQQLARQLCRSDPGVAIRDEIALWNRNTIVVAVRDNRDAGAKCKDTISVEGYVPDACQDSAWLASFAPSSAAVAAAASAAATVLPGGPVDTTYGFMRRDARGTGPWRRFDASTVPNGKLVLRSAVKPDGSRGRRRVAVDVIGDLDPSDPPVVVAAAAGEAPARVENLCERAQTSNGCQRAAGRPGGRMPRGVRLTFDFDAIRPVEFRIAIKPTTAVSRKVAALEKAQFATPDYKREHDDQSVIKLTDRIQIRCRRVDPAVIADDPDDEDESIALTSNEGGAAPELDLCSLYWVVPEPQPRVTSPAGTVVAAVPSGNQAPSVPAPFAEPGLLNIRLGAPEALTLTRSVKIPETTGKPAATRIVASDEAKQLALLPVVGLDDTDTDSLLGQLRRKVPPGGQRDIELTIDARLQRASFDVLKRLMGREAQFADINHYLPGRFDRSRRGSIILIDAGASGPGGTGFDTDAGRILASASWPQIDQGMSEWDLRSYSQYRPWESPLAARGWSGNDKYNAPGSSLKPINALAGIDRAARGDNAIADFLGAEANRRGPEPGAMRNFGGPAAAFLQFGYTSKALLVPAGPNKTVRIKTVSGSICADLQRKDLCQTETIPPHAPAANMRNMIVHSNNIWFARLALALDLDGVTTTNANGRREEITSSDAPVSRPLSLARMVSRLWPAEARDIMLGDQVGRYSRVRATSVQLDETDPSRLRQLSVALNGIGQAAQATPLAMATMFASIATGRIVLPRLAAGNDGRPMRGAPLLDPASVDGLPLDQLRAEEMVRNLRVALAEVVRGGTAAGRFGPLTERVSGKTGTAQVGQNADDPNTVWFVGWIEGLRVPGLEPRRVAFACMITHADNDEAGGGRVCAPLMRILLERIEAQHQTAQPAPRSRK